MRGAREIAGTRTDGTRKKAKVAETTGEEERVDRLSRLPDSVLIHILSLLPTSDAVKTLMIPSLGRLWDQTFNLDFDWCVSHGCSRNSSDQASCVGQFRRFVDFVDRAMNLHKSPRIFKFRLKVNCTIHCYQRQLMMLQDPEEDGRAGNRILLARLLDLWLESAVRRNVELFDLDFIAYVPGFFYDYVLPAFVLQSNSLVELRLVSCSLKSCKASSMKSLKSLYFKDITLTDEMIADLLSASPVLETLSLVDCYGFRRVSCTSPMLKTVIISPDVLSQWEIEVSGPYIVSLYISGWIEHIDLVDLPSLHSATIDIGDRFCCVLDEYVLFKRFFEKLGHAKVVTMHEQPILVTMMIWDWELLGIQCPPSKWQCLILKTKLNKWHLPGVSNLLRNSPSLERLNLHILPGELPQTSVPDMWLNLYEFDEEDYWTAKDHSFSCLRNGLKTVKISGDVTRSTVLELVRFLLSKAQVLEQLIISIGMQGCSTETNKLKKYKESVLNCPIASRNAVVMFC